MSAVKEKSSTDRAEEMEAIIAELLAQAEEAKLGLEPGDEFTVVSTRLGSFTDITDEEFDRVIEQVDALVAAKGAMVEALHDAKCDFVVI